MIRTSKFRGVLNGLQFRVAAMLSLALLPIGLIAVNQTKQVADSARRNAELVLLTQTESATFDVRFTVEQARGAARLLGASQIQLENPEECERKLAAFVDSESRFSFVGVLPKSGLMTCSSAERSLDFSNWPKLAENMDAAVPVVGINQDAPLSGKSVIFVLEPYFENGEMAGMIAISIPHDRLNLQPASDPADGLVNAMTFNNEGDILTSERPLELAEDDLPKGLTLPELIGQGAYSFSREDKQGNGRIYTVIPIVENVVYTLGVWEENSTSTEPMFRHLPAWVFPVIMWVVSLGVAFSAVNRLVIRHVRRLGRQMNAFATARELPDEKPASQMSAEFAEIEDDFEDMSGAILLEEAKLENSLRDKNVLLKEVHHRVKNNLQLISSIINMQIRNATSLEARQVLSRVQDRVLSLATIHRDLYQSREAGRINVGALITEIAEKSIEIGEAEDQDIDLEMSIDSVFLYPDQAVPMSLLVSEAATNAMKYVGPDATGKRWIRIALTCEDDRDCSLIIENSIGTYASDAESTGLGAQLIRAFSLQLGGQIGVETTETSYRLSVSFQAADFVAEVTDF